jgi:6-phosphogluconolactonase (cycloisomerase 2 family)
MKFWYFGRVALASTFSLGLALLLNSCGGGYTIAYLYVVGAFAASANTNPTPISILGINSETGAVYPVANSIAPANYTNAVAEVAAPNQKNLYVLFQGSGTAGSSSVVVQYGITNDGGNLNGDITPINSYNTLGTLPTSIAIDASDAYLYVVDTYAANSQTNGDVEVFPISSSGSLGTPTVIPLSNNQNAVGVTALGYTPASGTPCTGAPACYVYVASWNEADPSNPNGTVWAYQNIGGSLTLLASYSVGLELGSLTSFYSNIASYIYITDNSQSCIFGYNVSYSPPTPGALNGIVMSGCGSAGQGAQYGVATNGANGGTKPTAVLVEPRGKYLFVANTGANTIGSYLISQSQGGQLSATSSGGAATGTGPLCLAIDPVLGKYLFTADYLSSVNSGGNLTAGGTVSGYSLNSSTGTLTNLPNGPFIIPTTLPSCVAASTVAAVPQNGTP